MGFVAMGCVLLRGSGGQVPSGCRRIVHHCENSHLRKKSKRLWLRFGGGHFAVGETPRLRHEDARGRWFRPGGGLLPGGSRRDVQWEAPGPARRSQPRPVVVPGALWSSCFRSCHNSALARPGSGPGQGDAAGR